MKTQSIFPQSMKGVVRDFFRQEVFRRRTVHITPADYEKISSLIELDILDQECMADEGLTQTISVQGYVDVPLSTRGYDISVAYTAELTVKFTRNYFPEWGVYETVLHDREISDFSVASAEVWDCLAEEEASSDFDKNLIKIR